MKKFNCFGKKIDDEKDYINYINNMGRQLKRHDLKFIDYIDCGNMRIFCKMNEEYINKFADFCISINEVLDTKCVCNWLNKNNIRYSIRYKYKKYNNFKVNFNAFIYYITFLFKYDFTIDKIFIILILLFIIINKLKKIF